MSVIGFPSGSPFLGIPLGVMTWFFLGTLQKLADEHAKGTFTETTTVPAAPDENAAPAKKFYYYKPDQTPRPPR